MESETEKRKTSLVQAFLLSLAFVLALFGQMLFYSSVENFVLGVIFDVVALALFGWVVILRRPTGTFNVLGQIISLRVALILIAFSLSLLTVFLALLFDRVGRISYLPVLIAWLSGALVYVLAFVEEWKLPNWRERLRANQWEAIGLGSVFTMGFVFRFYRLGAIPKVINGDEGVLGLAALRTVTAPLSNPFRLYENFGAFYLQCIDYTMWLLGATPFALRLLPAIGGTLAVLSVYLLTRHLLGFKTALVAAAFLATAHAHLHFSRTVAVGYIQGTFLIPLELYFFISGIEKRSWWRLALGGIILGIHFNIYISAQIIFAILIVYWLVAALICRPLIQQAGWRVWAMWLGVGIVALPNFVYSILQSGEFTAQLSSEGTFQSGWLAEEIIKTGSSPILILLNRISHVFLSFTYYPARSFYGAPSPVLDPIMGSLFIFGIAYSLWHTRDHRYLLLNGYFWGVVVAIGLFAIPPEADTYRILMAMPVAVIFAALGLKQLITGISAFAPPTSWLRFSMATLILIPMVSLNLRIYFMDFAARCRYGDDERTRFASYLGTYLDSVERETRVFLLSDNDTRYGTHPSVDFLSGGIKVTNVNQSVDTIKDGHNMAIIAIATRADELRAWAIDHPDGKFQREYDCEKLIMLAYYIP